MDERDKRLIKVLGVWILASRARQNPYLVKDSMRIAEGAAKAAGMIVEAGLIFIASLIVSAISWIGLGTEIDAISGFSDWMIWLLIGIFVCIFTAVKATGMIMAKMYPEPEPYIPEHSNQQSRQTPEDEGFANRRVEHGVRQNDTSRIDWISGIFSPSIILALITAVSLYAAQANGARTSIVLSIVVIGVSLCVIAARGEMAEYRRKHPRPPKRTEGMNLFERFFTWLNDNGM